MAGENLDLSSNPPEPGPSAQPQGGEARRFVGVQFGCCGIYARIYINRQGTGYEGACPRCARRVQMKIGPGGSDARFFTAY